MSSPDPTPEPLINPYAAPRTDLLAPPPATDDDLAHAEATRRAHLLHETSIKQIGTLHYLGALVAIGVLVSAVVFFAAREGGAGSTPWLAMVVVYGGLGGLNIALGTGLRRLQSWARWVEAALVGLSLVFWLMAAVGTLLLGAAALLVIYAAGILFQAYVLYLLLSPKGAVVFSPSYRDVIARTPHLRYRTSWVAKLALGVFIAAVALAVLGALLGRKG